MTSSPLVRALGAALAAALGPALLAGCGKPPPPPPPDPPRVTVAPSASSVADTKLTVKITVSGCAEVSDLSLWNRDVHVTGVAYAGNPTTVEIQPNQLKYHDGLAADVALVARVTCDDGRQGASTPAGVRYLPVAEVIRAEPGFQVVTDVFWADGQGANVGFIGCSGAPGSNEQALVQVNRAGQVAYYTTELPFPCTTALQITERTLATGKRWALEPGKGVFAFRPNATGGIDITVSATGDARYLSVGPEGDAFVYFAKSGEESIRRIAHDATGPYKGGTDRWANPYVATGVVMGAPGLDPTLGVHVAVWHSPVGQHEGTVGVERADYDAGFQVGARLDMRTVEYGLGDAPPIPPAIFSPSGALVYFPFQTAADATRLVACASNAAGCGTGTGLAWQRNLPGHVVLVVPFSGNSILAAVSPRYTWFLDAATGGVLNRDGKPVEPEGALVTMGVQPGRGRDFYLLNGSGQPGTLPSEVVAVDDPAFGPLYRYALNGGHVMVGVDESGQAWLRLGPDLVRPLPLSEYQLVVQR